MATEIAQVTDFSAVENAIADWVESVSALPKLKGSPKTTWAGFDIKRKRPFALVRVISQRVPAQPWTSKEMVVENGIDKYVTTYYEPWEWMVSATFFSDSYTKAGKPIRENARHYAQQAVNRSKFPTNQTILREIQTNTDSDKYIHQATVDFMFSGIAVTDVKDSDFFTSVTEPELILSGE